VLHLSIDYKSVIIILLWGNEKIVGDKKIASILGEIKGLGDLTVS